MNDISQDEVATYASAVGREQRETDTVGAHLVALLAATLDRVAAGAALPPLWHYGLFHASAPTRTLGPDGHPPRGAFKTVGCPLKLSDSPAGITRPPMLGEHTESVLGELCGVSPEDVKRMKQEGIV